MSMQCPTCGGRSQVVDTRGVIRRRRCLENPSHYFETTERVSYVGKRQQGRPPGTRRQQDKWAGLK